MSAIGSVQPGVVCENPSVPPRHASKLAIALALIAVYVFWGSTFLGIKVAVEALPPLLSAGFRFALAGAILVGVALARGAARPSRAQWRAAAYVGVLMLGAGNGAVTWAESSGVGSGLAALVVSTSPIWLVLVDRVRYGNRITWPQVVGVLTGLAGTVILLSPGTAGMPLLPAVVLVLSGLLWAMGTLASRSDKMPADGTLANGMSMLTGAVALLALGAIGGEPAHLGAYHLALRSLLGLAWLVVFGSLLGFSCYLWLIRVAPVVLVSTQSYVSPVIAVALGAAVLGERIGTRTVVAGGVIVASVVLVASAPLLTRRAERQQLKRREAA